MKGIALKFLRWLGRKARGHFFAGILITVPLGLTVWVFVQIFNWIDGPIQERIIEPIFDREIAGVGFAATLLLVYVAGVVASNVFGRRLIRYVESLLARIPVAGYFYGGIRQILQSFSAPDKTGFMQVVLVEFPRKGTRTIGFITNEVSDQSGKKLLNVFIPTSPNPTSGFLQILDEDQIIRTDMSVDDALKMVVSGGRMSSPEIGEKLFVGGQTQMPTE